MRFGFQCGEQVGEVTIPKQCKQAIIAMMVRDVGQVYGRPTHMSVWLSREVSIGQAEDLIFDEVDRCACQVSLLLSLERSVVVLN